MGKGDSASINDFPRLVDWKARGEIVNIDNVDLFYYASEGFAEGVKPRLVLIHGYPTCSFDYWRVLPSLEEHFSVFTWDLLGFGFSEKVYAPAARQVKLLLLLFEKVFGVNVATPIKFHLFSHDLGDTVAQEIIARKQELVELPVTVLSWVALNGGLIPGEHRPTTLQWLLLNKWIGPVVARFASISTMRKTISKVFGPHTQPTPLEYEEWWFLMNHQGGDKLRTENIKYMSDRITFKERYVEAMKKYSEDYGMLLINGPYDPVSGRHSALALQSQVPNAQVEFLGNEIGHYPQLEAPKEVLSYFFKYHFEKTEALEIMPDIENLEIPDKS